MPISFPQKHILRTFSAAEDSQTTWKHIFALVLFGDRLGFLATAQNIEGLVDISLDSGDLLGVMDEYEMQKTLDSLSSFERTAINELLEYVLGASKPKAECQAISEVADNQSDGVTTDNSSNRTNTNLTIAEKAVEKERLTFFSLPRELRDMVYGYLLDGRCTSSGKDRRFHTNILATNSNIRDEAEKIMAERNIFILVNLRLHGFNNPTKSFSWIRIVAQSRLERFRRHHMSLRINGRSWSTVPTHGVRSRKIALLLDDLPLFFSAMRIALHCCNGNSTHLQRMAPGQLTVDLLHDRESDGVAPSSANIHLFDTGWRSMSLHLCTALLRPLEGLAMRRLHMTFSGRVMQQQRADRLITTLAPSLIHTYAHYWQLLDSLYDARSVAEDLIEIGEYDAALDAILRIENAGHNVCGHLAPYLPSDIDDVALATRILTAEIQVTACYLLLRSVPHRVRDYDTAFNMSAKLRHTVSFLELPRVQRGVIATMWHMALLESGLMRPRDQPRQSLKDWDDCPHASDPYVKYDIAVFCCYVSPSSVAVPIPLGALSMIMLPPRVVDSRTKPTGLRVPERPDYVKGLIDTDHLARLTPQEKAHIRACQVRNNTIPLATETLLD